MSRALPLGLALAACLSATIAWEVQEAAWPEIAAAAPRIPTQADMPPAPRRVENEEAPQAWAMTMLGRPLFRKDRRPEQPAADHGARTDARARLTGVVIGPFGKRAIFRSGENTKSIVVQEGAQVGDFVIRSIEPGRAVIESNGDLQILTPSFADGRAPQRR